MAESLTLTTLRLYRQLRTGHPPEEAIELLRGHVRIAREYAIADLRMHLAGLLRDQESHLTFWLQDVRVRIEQPGRHGTYWETGYRSDPLVYTVIAWQDGEHLGDEIRCDSPGCAIKHALSLFCDEAVSYVTIDANRPKVSYTIGRDATMAALALLDWPVR